MILKKAMISIIYDISSVALLVKSFVVNGFRGYYLYFLAIRDFNGEGLMILSLTCATVFMVLMIYCFYRLLSKYDDNQEDKSLGKGSTFTHFIPQAYFL